MAVPAEVLLLSALVNTGSVGQEVSYGISCHDFVVYTDEYTWLSTYLETYQAQPGPDIFQHKFPGFPLVAHNEVRSACDQVHAEAYRRRLTNALTEAVQLVGSGQIAQAHQALTCIQPGRAVARPKPLLIDTAHLDEWDTKPYCIQVPYETLQRLTGGIRKGNLWYLAARPGQGKSAHVGNISKRACLDGNRVLFCSLEMSESEVRNRFHAAMATEFGRRGPTLNDLINHQTDRAAYRALHGEIAERLKKVDGNLDVLTPADGPISPSSLAMRASEYDLIVIDYVGLMAADGGGAAIDDWRVMARISNSLKNIALAHNVGILCAAQINRDGETGFAPPKVKNLAQSDALGQDGDVVLTMRAKPHNVATFFSLEKNRHGPSGVYFYTTFDPNRGVYTEVSADRVDDLVMDVEALADNPIPQPIQLRVVKSKDEL